MTRRAHLVGSIPGSNAEEAMRSALERLAPYLLTLTDGETGFRSWWIGAPLHNSPTKEKTPLYSLKPGHTLDSARLEGCLPYATAFDENFSLFRNLWNEYHRPDLPFQVGIPAHLDLSVDAFGFQEGFASQHYEPSLAATAAQIRKVQAVGRGDVLFQMENARRAHRGGWG